MLKEIHSRPAQVYWLSCWQICFPLSLGNGRGNSSKGVLVSFVGLCSCKGSADIPEIPSGLLILHRLTKKAIEISALSYCDAKF